MKNPLLCCCSSFPWKSQRIPLSKPSFFRQHCSGPTMVQRHGRKFLIIHQKQRSTPTVPQGHISTTLPNIIHTTKTGPLFEDGKGFWGGWRGRGGYQSIADNHSVWPQPCNAWPTSNVYIFSVFFCLLLWSKLLWLIVLVLLPTFLQYLPHCHTLVRCMQLKFDKNT